MLCGLWQLLISELSWIWLAWIGGKVEITQDHSDCRLDSPLEFSVVYKPDQWWYWHAVLCKLLEQHSTSRQVGSKTGPDCILVAMWDYSEWIQPSEILIKFLVSLSRSEFKWYWYNNRIIIQSWFACPTSWCPLVTLPGPPSRMDLCHVSSWSLSCDYHITWCCVYKILHLESSWPSQYEMCPVSCSIHYI